LLSIHRCDIQIRQGRFFAPFAPFDDKRVGVAILTCRSPTCQREANIRGGLLRKQQDRRTGSGTWARCLGSAVDLPVERLLCEDGLE